MSLFCLDQILFLCTIAVVLGTDGQRANFSYFPFSVARKNLMNMGALLLSCLFLKTRHDENYILFSWKCPRTWEGKRPCVGVGDGRYNIGILGREGIIRTPAKSCTLIYTSCSSRRVGNVSTPLWGQCLQIIYSRFKISPLDSSLVSEQECFLLYNFTAFLKNK